MLRFIRFQKIEVLPNHKVLGAKCRADLPKVLSELSQVEPDSFLSEIDEGKAKLAGFDITIEDINIKRVEKEGYAASTFDVEEIGDISLVLDVDITDDLISKGLKANEPINIQFTSGTTGAPKGATLSHENIINNAKKKMSKNETKCLGTYYYFSSISGMEPEEI